MIIVSIYIIRIQHCLTSFIILKWNKTVIKNKLVTYLAIILMLSIESHLEDKENKIPILTPSLDTHQLAWRLSQCLKKVLSCDNVTQSAVLTQYFPAILHLPVRQNEPFKMQSDSLCLLTPYLEHNQVYRLHDYLDLPGSKTSTLKVYLLLEGGEQSACWLTTATSLLTGLSHI